MKYLPALLVFLFLQDSDLDKARRHEQQRIASKKPLTEEARSSYQTLPKLPEEPAAVRQKLDLDIVRVGFPDAKWDGKDWKKRVFEPVKAYFKVASDGAFQLTGRMLDPITARVKREKIKKWRSGAKTEAPALASFAGTAGANRSAVLFVLQGVPGSRESVFWPHAGVMSAGDIEVRFVVTMSDIKGYDVGALAHEIGHLFDLPDKYEDPDYSAGPWCLMGTGYEGKRGDKTHAPLALCADCRARVGWIRVHKADGRKTGRYVIEPIETSRRALRVPINRDGTESLLLEARKGQGLLIWHVDKGRTTAFLGRFPKKTTDRLTPFSEPSFRGRGLGAQAIYLTDIRFEDGRAFLTVGPRADLTDLEKLRRSNLGKRLGDK